MPKLYVNWLVNRLEIVDDDEISTMETFEGSLKTQGEIFTSRKTIDDLSDCDQPVRIGDGVLPFRSLRD